MLILFVLCLGALLGRSNMLMLVFGLTAGPFVLNGQITLGILRQLRVTRRLPEQAMVGESFSVSLALSNQKRLLSSWLVVAEDILRSPGEQLQPAVLFACVPPRSQREAAYDISPAHRGKYEFGPVRLMSRFPLGLMERSFELGPVASLIVYPRIGRMKPRWHKIDDSGEPVAERAQARVGARDDEFHRLREYRAGDNPRAIHWRTTARRNALMVREYQHMRRRDLLLVVDLWLPEKARPEDLERVELAVSFAASICVDQMQTTADSGLDLAIVGRETWHAVGPGGARSIGGLLEQLALAEAGPAAALAAAIGETAQRVSGQIRRVLITTRSQAAVNVVLQTSGSLFQLATTAEFDVIEATPNILMDYLEFDDRAVLIEEPA